MPANGRKNRSGFFWGWGWPGLDPAVGEGGGGRRMGMGLGVRSFGFFDGRHWHRDVDTLLELVPSLSLRHDCQVAPSSRISAHDVHLPVGCDDERIPRVDPEGRPVSQPGFGGRPPPSLLDPAGLFDSGRVLGREDRPT